MDEAGEDDYIDTNSYKVIVPSDYPDDKIKIGVRRKSKRSTLIHSISADGCFLKPLIIIPREAVDSILLKKLTSNNLLLKFQSKGYSNCDLIQYWLEKIFFLT